MKIQLGITDVLGVVFIVLKLAGVIQWKWVWVLAPLWIELILIGVLFIIYLASKNRGGIY